MTVHGGCFHKRAGHRPEWMLFATIVHHKSKYRVTGSTCCVLAHMWFCCTHAVCMCTYCQCIMLHVAHVVCICCSSGTSTTTNIEMFAMLHDNVYNILR